VQSDPEWLKFCPVEFHEQYRATQKDVVRRLEPPTPERPNPQQEVPTPRVPDPENQASTSQSNPATVASLTEAMEAVSVQDNSGASTSMVPNVPCSNAFDFLAFLQAP